MKPGPPRDETYWADMDMEDWDRNAQEMRRGPREPALSQAGYVGGDVSHGEQHEHSGLIRSARTARGNQKAKRFYQHFAKKPQVEFGICAFPQACGAAQTVALGRNRCVIWGCDQVIPAIPSPRKGDEKGDEKRDKKPTIAA